VDLGDGIYLFQTPPYSDVGLDGNTVVIVSRDGVLVFDSNGTPDAAAAVLSEIRKITGQPVRYLVHSHWHWDHWYGAQVYRDAFPGLQVISHERTRTLMAGPAIHFNQPGLDTQLPDHIAQVEARLARVRDSAADAPAIARLERHLAEDRRFLEQKRQVRPVLATTTFADSLTIPLGGRVVKVLHHDRAITPGDAYLYLPAERVVITGDLLINPITFALFCYPAGWIATLRSIAALEPRLLVPGHGAPLHDQRLLEATIQLLEREREIGRSAHAAGRSVADATAEVLADQTVLALREIITAGDRTRRETFALYLVDWFVRRVFQEADGTLDDSIPAIP
jgi:glyoxylase-like metal-dependent hydrolase (beta-lactamase superfamily II)